MDIIEDISLPLGIILLCISIFFWVKESTESYRIIENSLKEKEYLMREAHHRIKNNLTIISSLISIQQDRIGKNDRCKDILEDISNRIRSIAFIHDKLNDTKDFKQINIKEYINDIVINLVKSLSHGNIKMLTDIINVFFDIDISISLGLITTELVTNAIKYGFDPLTGGELSIKLEKINSDYKYIIKNKGIQLQKNIDIENTNTLGLSIARSLVKQISGKITFEANDWTCFTITFPYNKEIY